MKFLATALGDDADLSAGSAAVFGGIVGRENLNLLRGVDVGDADGAYRRPAFE